MMMRRFELFRIFGFPIRVDLSWLFILFLVTYSLAAGFFPANHPGLPNTAYWAMGFVAAIGLFLSILFHELSHSLVARHYKIKIDGITLFIFGGVAEMKEESDSPKVEFLVAVMGPIASMLLAALFIWLSRVTEAQGMNRGLILIFYYLGFMNAILAIFNLVPAFPLDGGRIFRSVLWALKKDYLWATKVAALLGQIFGWVLVGFGIVSFFRGSAIGGIWYVLIGFFLKRASQMSLQVVRIQGELEKIPLSEVTDSNFIQFSPRDRMVDV
ncbi:MAG: site-2 protease family protein, partial [bacterium]|nr:site-2 protease family protein [bacterium]